MTLQIIDKKNKKVGDVKLSDSTIEKVNKAVLYYAIKSNRNGLRRGTAAVKDRSDVNKVNKKIYRQKGTGNARHGSRRVNIFVGGGSAHGPRPRSYTEKLNKKFTKASLRETFKYLIQNDALKVFNELNFDKPSTKDAALVLKNLSLSKALVVLPKENKNAVLSFRNIKNVKVINDASLNVFDLVRYENVMMTQDLFEKVKERYAL